MKRALSPSTNPAGLLSAVAVIYAAVIMIWNVAHHHGAIDPQVIVAAVGAAAALYTRFLVTPVRDPKDGNGASLLHVPLTAISIAGSVASFPPAAAERTTPPPGSAAAETIVPPAATP